MLSYPTQCISVEDLRCDGTWIMNPHQSTEISFSFLVDGNVSSRTECALPRVSVVHAVAVASPAQHDVLQCRPLVSEHISYQMHIS